MKKLKVNLLKMLKTILLPVIVYLVLLIATGGRFGKPSSLLMVFRLSVIPIMIAYAIGMNMTIGMWDFSVGGIIYASAILGGTLSHKTGTGVWGMFIFIVGIAILFSTLNGILYKLMKIPSLVLTTGMLMVYEALPRVIGIKEVKISISDGVLAQMPWCYIILFVMFALFYVVYNKTSLGYNVKATGANQIIASNAGIDIEKVKFQSFLFGGVFAGLAAVLLLSNNTTIRPIASMGSIHLLFDAMMGVFIAFFLSSSCNFAVGIVIGTVSMQMLTSGLVAMGLDTNARSIASGLFLLILLIISSNQGSFAKMVRRKQLAKEANLKYTEG
ncbi:MAG TPA: hypothetical protein GXX14_11685 [Clostridiaceae bacterium]|nr:hypothetical protein [Clostridiaceae bacterium]